MKQRGGREDKRKAEVGREHKQEEVAKLRSCYEKEAKTPMRGGADRVKRKRWMSERK